MSTSTLSGAFVLRETPSTPISRRQAWDKPGSFLENMPFSLYPPISPGLATKSETELSPMRFSYHVTGDPYDLIPVPTDKPRKSGRSKRSEGKHRATPYPSSRQRAGRAVTAGAPEALFTRPRASSATLEAMYRPGGVPAFVPQNNDVMYELAASSGRHTPPASPSVEPTHSDRSTPASVAPPRSLSLAPSIVIAGGASGADDEAVEDIEGDDPMAEVTDPAIPTTCVVHPQHESAGERAAAAGQGVLFPADSDVLAQYLSQGMSLACLFPCQVVGTGVICRATKKLEGAHWETLESACTKFCSSTEIYVRHVKETHVGHEREPMLVWMHNLGVPYDPHRINRGFVVAGALPLSALPKRAGRPKKAPKTKDSTNKKGSSSPRKQ